MFLPLGRCLHSFRSAAGSCQESTETAPAKDSAEGILEEASLQRCDFWAKDDASFLDFFSLLVIGCRPMKIVPNNFHWELDLEGQLNQNLQE